jgi:hypothetical protein
VGAYCKNPKGCDGIVMMADDADVSKASCSICSATFCATCDLAPHTPVTCEMVSNIFTHHTSLTTSTHLNSSPPPFPHLHPPSPFTLHSPSPFTTHLQPPFTTFPQVARWEENGGYLESAREEDAAARKLKHQTTKVWACVLRVCMCVHMSECV